MKAAYLIGQYPAINHGYLLTEIAELRKAGWEILTASIERPDRPASELSPRERAEYERTYYIKQAGAAAALRTLGALLIGRPLCLLGALGEALAMGRGWRGVLYQIFYLAEAALCGRWMQQGGATHCHVSFSLNAGLLLTRLYPEFSMSFAVYGFGELHNPEASYLARKIEAARWVRAISYHTRSLLMLACRPEAWTKLECVPLGIEPAGFPPRPFRPSPSPFRLITVGRLSPEKGTRLLAGVMRRLRERGHPVILHLVGGGPDREMLETAFESLGLKDAVVFEGRAPQQRLMDLYRESDIFVLPSLYEGVPTVCIEAMSMEIPCVAPAITGIPELMQDGVEGVLYPPGDEEAMAGAIERLIMDPDLRRRIGEAGRRKALARYDLAMNTIEMSRLLARYR